MSNDTQKADQIALHLFTKLFQVVYHARITREPRPSQKVDKWFNLETPETDALSKDDRDKFKSISSSPPQPLEIQVLLTVPELGNNQVLVYHPDAVSGTQPPQIRIYPTPKRILLESWTLSYTPRDGPPDTTVPSTTYKHGILLFRTVFSLLRLLPAWR
ncbi:phosphorylated protein that interacts with Vac8p, partial [Fistulina hepatica ATCC 64428]